LNDAQLRARALAQHHIDDLVEVLGELLAVSELMEIAEMLREEEVVRARRNTNRPPQPR
jgi:hypothetical protein